jgi:hypothetical protein
MKSLDEILETHPPDWDRVAEFEQQKLAQTRGYRLLEMREALGMTQFRLSNVSGLNLDVIDRIEVGDVEELSVATLRSYVEAVGGTLRIEVEYSDSRYRVA